MFVISSWQEPLYIASTKEEARRVIDLLTKKNAIDNTGVYNFVVTNENDIISIERSLKNTCGPVYSALVNQYTFTEVIEYCEADVSSSDGEEIVVPKVELPVLEKSSSGPDWGVNYHGSESAPENVESTKVCENVVITESKNTPLEPKKPTIVCTDGVCKLVNHLKVSEFTPCSRESEANTSLGHEPEANTEQKSSNWCDICHEECCEQECGETPSFDIFE